MGLGGSERKEVGNDSEREERKGDGGGIVVRDSR